MGFQVFVSPAKRKAFDQAKKMAREKRLIDMRLFFKQLRQDRTRDGNKS